MAIDYTKLSDSDLRAIAANNVSALSDEALRMIAGQSAAVSKPVSAPSTERSWGDVAKDIPAGVLSGVGSLLQVPGQLVGLVPGMKGVGEALEAPGEAVQKFGTDLKSAGLKAREALRSQSISEAAKDGILSEFATAITSTLKDPALITSFITEQAPLLIGPLGAARLTAKLGMSGVEAAGAAAAKGLTGEAAEIASQKAMDVAAKQLGKRATTAAIGTGAAMEAGDTSSETYKRTLNRALEMNMSREEAEAAAIKAARIAALGAGAVSLGANIGLSKLGGDAIERALAGLPGKGRVQGAFGEATSETLEGSGGQIFQNIGVRTVDPNQSLTEGVGAAAGLSVLGGGFFGGMLSKKPDAALAPGQRPGESLYDTAARLNREIKNLEDLAKLGETDQGRTDSGLLTNMQLVDMYREQGYGAVRQYQQQLVDRANDPTTPPEQRVAAQQAAKEVQDLFKQVTQEEVSRQMPLETQYTITDSDLRRLEIKGSDPLYKAAFGKDIRDPAQVQEIEDAIEAELNRKGLRQTQEARILRFKQALDFVIAETLPAGGLSAATTVQPSGGEGAGVAGVTTTGAAAAGSGAAKPSRVVPAEPAIEEPTGGKAEPTTPVMEDDITPQKAEAPAETTVVEEEKPAPAVSRYTPESEALFDEIKALETEQQSLLTKAGRIPAVNSKARQRWDALDEQIAAKKDQWGAMTARKAEPAAPAPVVTPAVSSLPKDLAGAKPRYSYGEKQFQLQFNSDIDKALYITAQKTPSRRDADYRAWLSQQGFTPEQITQEGQRVREAIKGVAAKADPAAGPINLPEQVKKPTVKKSLAPEVKEKLEPIYKRLEQRVKTAKPEAKPEAKAEEAKAPKEKTQKEALMERRAELIKELDGILKKILAKYNLTGVTLNLEEGMEEEGSYSGQIIKLALNLENPVRVLRHESIHALKDMGFFSDAQWKTLVKRAQDEWVDKYLKKREHNEDTGQSRYEAYVELLTKEGLNPTEVQEAIIEEAIADAFGDFDVNGAPPGLLAAIHRRMKNLFKAIKEAFGRAGIDTAEEIFGKIEKGSLKPAIPMSKEQAPKMSLRGVPLSTRPIMEASPIFAMNELGLKTEGEKKPGGIFLFNDVRSIANALNNDTINNYGVIDREDRSPYARSVIARAIADEVTYQIGTTSETGTGLGWYSNNYPRAVKRLAKKYPELGYNPHARSVFSALVAVTSNGEKVSLNIKNAIGLYAKLRAGEPLVAPGSRRATALDNNLQVVQDLLAEHGENFKNVLLQEILVKDMNAEFRARGKKPSGDYLATTKIPAAAIYFGPKLGAFYANLEGAEGYLTMDMWWTRSINRMRGLLMPQATESSIKRFRDIAGNPDMTRDEVISSTVPLRNRYEELDWTTELEYLAGEKEPSTNEGKPRWTARAKRIAGPAYEQLKLEHDVMKMANTIYKNEYEMLEEAPFGPNDREFMYRATRDAQRLLKQDGIDLTLADIQAALWYYEKRLYQHLSGRKADDIGYDEAISAVARESDRPEGPSVVFDKGVNRGAVPGASVEDIEGVRGQPAKGEGVTDEAIRSGEPAVRPSLRSRQGGENGPGRRPESARDRGGRLRYGATTPLQGAPSVPGFHGPDPSIVKVAEKYAKENGIKLRRQSEFAEIDEDRATRIAQAFEDLRHDPQDPATKRAYRALIDQTIAQYRALEDAGYEFWFIDLENPDNLEYIQTPWNAMRDLRQNKRMGVFPTESGFGSDENFNPINNPLLEETEFMWPFGGPNGPKHKVLANDLFRAVHDAFGHGMEGAGFRARGEENAYQAHVRLFTGEAIPAITSETRGQNSWVNYGPYGEFNRTAKGDKTEFAPQKVGLLPEWTWKEGMVADEPVFEELDPQTDAEMFRNAVDRVKRGRRMAFPLHVHDVETYQNARLFLSDDKESGFAIIGDEIASFFSGGKGQAYPTLRRAVEEGGRRIDAYRSVMPKVLVRAGFKPVARVEFNPEFATEIWDYKKFAQFQGGKPDLVFFAYEPSVAAEEGRNSNELVEATPLVEYDEALRLQREAVDQSKKSLRGIVLGEKQSGASSFDGTHYGNAKVNELAGSKYGTGIRGAERRRLDNAYDDRIKRRVYFYINKEDGTMPIPESGLGEYVYTQKFDNILGPGPEMSRLFREANGDSNDFESNVIDAGYDGYAVPSMGMMVVLNHDVPVKYQGTRVEVASKKSLRSQTPEFKFWFGQSKIVDKDGKPKVMYHGTARDITEFRGKQAAAIFLTDDPEVSTGYSQESATWMADHVDEFLTPKQIADSIKAAKKEMRENGYRPDQIAALEKDKGILKTDEFRNAVSVYMPSAPNIVPLFVKAEYTFDFENPEHVKAVVNLVPGLKADDFKRTNNWTTVEKPEVQEVLRAMGFDSFYVNEHGKKNLAVYSPTQVVSATGNVGAYGQRPITAEEAARFDMTEEQAAEAQKRGDIRFSLRSAPTTPEFKRWFGDSKFVNKDGSPKVLYHGTRADFSTFRVGDGAFGRGIYVAEDPERTKQYWGGYNKFSDMYGSPTGGNIMPVYVRMENPKVIDTDIFKVKRPDGSKVPPKEAAKYITDQAIAEGHDGLVTMMGDKIWEAVVFSPDQIKSAIGNIGTYDPTSPDIRRSLRSTLPASAINAMDRIAPPRYNPGYAEKIMSIFTGDTFTSIRQKFINRYERLAEYDRRVAKQLRQMGGAAQMAESKAETAALFSDLGAGVLEAAMGVHDRVGGAPIFRNGVTTVSNFGGTVKGLLEIFRPISNSKDPDMFRMYQTWAAVKRGMRLDAEGREDLILPAEIRAINNLSRTNPDMIRTFEAVQKDWLAYNNALVKYQVDTGVISPAMAREWTKHGDYFPFYRLMDGDDIAGPKTFSSIGNVRPPKKLKGGEDPLGDFFENIVRNSQAAIQAGMKNVAAQRATEQAMRLGEVSRLTAKQSGVEVYRVYENGKEVYYKSHDPLFIEAIKALNMADIPFMGLLAQPASMLRNLVTKDPAFMLANMMRDSLSAWATTGIKMTPVLDTLNNFSKAIAGKSPELDMLYSAGILGGYDYALGSKEAAREFETQLRRRSGKLTPFEIGTKPFTSLWGALEKGTQASDAATRIEVYKKTLAATGNEAEALAAALEVMNFNRKGNNPMIRVLTAAVPFLNARIQGLDVLFRTAIMPLGGTATEQAQQRMKTFWVRGMTMLFLSSAYWLLTHDDDEYKKQEQETRDNNWLIPSLGIKIPIPFEVGVMFKVIPERIMALSFGTDTSKDFTDSMKRQFVSTFAFNPIPQLVLPAYEVKTNHSFFTDRPIIGKGLENVAPQYQIGPSTSRVAQIIGDSLGFSPMKTDHLIKGYTGTIGTYASDLFDMIYDMGADSPKASKRFEQMPVIKRFALDPEARGTVTAYYKLKDEVDQAVRTANLLERSNNFEEGTKYTLDNLRLLATDDYVKDVEKSMKDYREMKQQIMAAPYSADTKRDLLKSIGKMESLTTANIQNIKKFAQ